MAVCEKCWSDAYLRCLSNPSKDQSEHYHDLLEERKDNPCTTVYGCDVPKEDKPVKSTCPTCGKDYKSNDPIFCSNSFHLPEPLNVKGATAKEIFIKVYQQWYGTGSNYHNNDGDLGSHDIMIFQAMQEYSLLQRNEAIQECIQILSDSETKGIALRELEKLKS